MKPGRLSPVAIMQYTDRYINMMKRSIADMDRKTATWLRFLRIFFVFQSFSVLFILLVPLGYKCLFNFMQQYMDLEISFKLLKMNSPKREYLPFWKTHYISITFICWCEVRVFLPQNGRCNRLIWFANYFPKRIITT